MAEPGRDLYFDRQGRPLAMRAWARLYENNAAYKRVAYDLFAEAVEVSTVWIGLNHNFTGVGPPLIFETMIFGHTPLHHQQWRYATQEQALAGHAEVVALVKLELAVAT